MVPNLFFGFQRNDIRIFSTPSITVIHGGKGGGEDGKREQAKYKLEIGDRLGYQQQITMEIKIR